VAAALAIWWFYPRWIVAANLVQVGAGIYMLLYLKINEDVAP
jgi:hypothetical protein